MARAFAEIAFTSAVRAIQDSQGTGKTYRKFLEPETPRADRLGPAEAAFVAERDGFYQATVSKEGWPYVQFRGGPAGFLQVLDDKTLAFADYRGNRQYISAGNISEDGRISMILMDYPNRRRLKVWGRARLVDAKQDPDLVARLMPEGYRAKPERAVVIEIEALDWNCPQHIPQRLTAAEWASVEPQLLGEIARLREENAGLRAAVARHLEPQA